jgi:hypothetical protein
MNQLPQRAGRLPFRSDPDGHFHSPPDTHAETCVSSCLNRHRMLLFYSKQIRSDPLL